MDAGASVGTRDDSGMSAMTLMVSRMPSVVSVNKYHPLSVTAEALEVAITPIFNNYRDNAVRGDKRFGLYLRFNLGSAIKFITGQDGGGGGGSGGLNFPPPAPCTPVPAPFRSGSRLCVLFLLQNTLSQEP